jgi:CheY-like chemotaxis protein
MMVVIVDDDPDDVDLYCELLAEIDPSITIKTFFQAPEVFPFLRQLRHLPDLIILDLNMPKMSGLEFLGQVRADPLLERLHVVVITTTCTNENTKAVLALRAACLRKQPGLEGFKTLLVRLLKEARKTVVSDHDE